MVLAWASLKTGNVSRYRAFMGATFGLGVAFLAVKVIEYADKLGHGLTSHE
jgi:heme/copper-type cytochrome/quinol oxidase subunit 3